MPLATADDSDEFYIDSVSTPAATDDQALVEIKCEDKLVRFKVDTGTQVNILPNNIFKKLGEIPLKPSNLNQATWVRRPETGHSRYVRPAMLIQGAQLLYGVPRL